MAHKWTNERLDEALANNKCPLERVSDHSTIAPGTVGGVTVYCSKCESTFKKRCDMLNRACQKNCKPNRVTDAEYAKRVDKASEGWVKPIGSYEENGYNTKFLHECTECNHQWDAFAGNILKGAWCPKCRGAEEYEERKAEFLEELKATHDGNISLISDYPAGGYQSEQMSYRCNTCEHEWTTWSPVHKGNGCPKCALKIKSHKLSWTAEEYLKRLHSVHGDSIKVLEPYKGYGARIMHECPEGHKWNALPKHLVGGHGCPTCAIKKVSDAKRVTPERYAERIREIHGDWIWPSEPYRGYGIKTEHSCSEGHKWRAIPDNLLQGAGCPLCARNNWSKVSDEWLSYIEAQEGITIQRASSGGEKTIRFKGKDGDKDSWIFADGFCEETNTVYEFHGSAYHGDPSWYWPDDTCHPKNKQVTAQELYETTQIREEKIREAGYNLVVIWESQYIEIFPVKQYIDSLGFKAEITDEFDILIPEKSIAINVYNVYRYSDSNLESKHYFNEQLKVAEEAGLRLISLYSDDWKYNTETTKLKLANILDVADSPTVYARKCKVWDSKVDGYPTAREAREFYTANHIQGYSGGSLNLGLYQDDVAVAIMSFKLRDKEAKVWELIRFATACKVPGGFSKLLKHFKENYDWTEILSFADLSWSSLSGNIYSSFGFELDQVIDPDYKYVEDGCRYHKFGYRKLALAERFPTLYAHNKSEYQITQEANIPRIYDCGKARYVMRR